MYLVKRYNRLERNGTFSWRNIVWFWSGFHVLRVRWTDTKSIQRDQRFHLPIGLVHFPSPHTANDANDCFICPKSDGSHGFRGCSMFTVHIQGGKFSFIILLLTIKMKLGWTISWLIRDKVIGFFSKKFHVIRGGNECERTTIERLFGGSFVHSFVQIFATCN